MKNKIIYAIICMAFLTHNFTIPLTQEERKQVPSKIFVGNNVASILKAIYEKENLKEKSPFLIISEAIKALEDTKALTARCGPLSLFTLKGTEKAYKKLQDRNLIAGSRWRGQEYGETPYLHDCRACFLNVYGGTSNSTRYGCGYAYAKYADIEIAKLKNIQAYFGTIPGRINVASRERAISTIKALADKNNTSVLGAITDAITSLKDMLDVANKAISRGYTWGRVNGLYSKYNKRHQWRGLQYFEQYPYAWFVRGGILRGDIDDDTRKQCAIIYKRFANSQLGHWQGLLQYLTSPQNLKARDIFDLQRDKYASAIVAKLTEAGKPYGGALPSQVIQETTQSLRDSITVAEMVYAPLVPMHKVTTKNNEFHKKHGWRGFKYYETPSIEATRTCFLRGDLNKATRKKCARNFVVFAKKELAKWEDAYNLLFHSTTAGSIKIPNPFKVKIIDDFNKVLQNVAMDKLIGFKKDKSLIVNLFEMSKTIGTIVGKTITLIKDTVELIRSPGVKGTIDDLETKVKSLVDQVNKIKVIVQKGAASLKVKPAKKDIPKTIAEIIQNVIGSIKIGMESFKTVLSMVKDVDSLVGKTRTIVDKVADEFLVVLRGDLHEKVGKGIDKVNEVLNEAHKTIEKFEPVILKLLDQISRFLDLISKVTSKATETKK